MTNLSSIARKESFDIPSSANIYDAMACMLDNGNGSAVLIEDKKPVGIVTESLIIEKLNKNFNFALPVKSIATTPVITVLSNRPVESAFDIMISNNIRRIVVVNEKNHYAGVVLQEDLFAFLEEDVYKVDLKIADIIKKDKDIVTLYDNASLYDALHLMHEIHIGSVVILNNRGKVAGIITEKDILSASYGGFDLYKSVCDVMSSPVITVCSESLVIEAIDIMKKCSIRRLLVTDNNGKALSLLTNRDIFRHIKGNLARMLEIKLRHAKEIMDMLPEAILEIFDIPGYQVIHWMNKRAVKIFGLNFLEQPPHKLLGHKSWNKIYKSLLQNHTIKGVRVSIDEKSFEFSGALSINLNSRYIKLIAKDITEHESIKSHLKDKVNYEIQRRMENEYLLMQQSRLASMGEMIGFIAHQWRQPLAQLGGVFMNIESAFAFGELNEEYLMQKVKEGNNMIKYMSQTIDDFRLFFEPSRCRESFDVVKVIKHTVGIVRASLNYYRINLKFTSVKNSFFTKGYQNEFAQVILNLLNNAKDMLIENQIKFPVVYIEVFKQNKDILIKIHDNAGGVREDIIDKIFEPYITTKGDKGGIGIGLYISRLIIENRMNGSISVKNQNKGANFIIKVPSSD